MESSVQAHPINEAAVDDLWKTFGVFDADGNGEISADELASVMQSLGQATSTAQLRSLIRKVDIDGSGYIDLAEFQTLMLARHGDRESRLRLAFSIFDQNGNLRLSPSSPWINRRR
jgi:Ca2+-binding EF-hand superfamily protein